MTSAHATAPASSKRERPRRYEVRVHGRGTGALADALGVVEVRYEPPASVLVGVLDQPQLYALLERLLTAVPLPVLDVRVAGTAAPAAASTGRCGPAPYEIEFAGAIATEAFAGPFGVAVRARADRTTLSGRLDCSAVAGLLAHARMLDLDLLALRRTPEAAEAVRVMIVDDHDEMRGALRDLVAAAPGFELVAEAASGEQALAAAPRARPMLVLMDLRMPGIGGLAAARRLTREAPSTVVVLVSADPRYTIDARAHGAAALLDKRDLRARGVLAALWRTHGPNDR